MEPKGESIAAAFLASAEGGASLELGGAHWFAASEGAQDQDDESDKAVEGIITIEVRSLAVCGGRARQVRSDLQSGCESCRVLSICS